MKKILALLLCGMLAAPAFAEVAPYYYYDDVEYVDEYGNAMYLGDDGNFYYSQEVIEEVPVTPATPAQLATSVAPVTTTAATTTGTAAAPTNTHATIAKTAVSPRATTGRTTTASRTTTSNAANGRVINRGATTTAARPISSRTTTGQSRGMVSTSTPSRASVSSYTPSAATTTTATNRTTASNANRNVTARAGLLQEDTINKPLYIGSGAANTDRVATRPTVIVGSSLNQSATSRTSAVSNSSLNNQTINSTDATATAAELSRATELCREQFYACMDNFCDVLDETQGRCVCSSNADRYKEIEDALKNATESLQDVAQKIQYIGLTKDEIEAIFKETEAESAMVGQKDTSQIKADLDKIRKMIIEVDSETYTTNNFSFLLDVDFSFDNGFDLYDWLMGVNGSVLRQRGSELYSSALSKCRTNVLESCRANGVDTTLITNNYDLAIDRQCIEYEKVLDDENEQMKRTVRNATNVLQKARLVIAQNKNIYDLRGCVNALDSCMQDDFACGADYEYCLDPTGKYIANGEVIVGSNPGYFDAGVIPTGGLYSIWNYTGGHNAWGNSGSVDEYITKQIKSTSSTDMVGFLQAKIGANDGNKNTGMCMSVLNQCQDYTYTGVNKSYNPANDVVRQYLMRSLATIKAQQDEILADFASSCITRVSSCLQSNNAETGYDKTNKGSVSYASYNACRSLINTCASVNNDPDGTNVIGSAICYLGTALKNLPPVNGKADCE